MMMMYKKKCDEVVPRYESEKGQGDSVRIHLQILLLFNRFLAGV